MLNSQRQNNDSWWKKLINAFAQCVAHTYIHIHKYTILCVCVCHSFIVSSNNLVTYLYIHIKIVHIRKCNTGIIDLWDERRNESNSNRYRRRGIQMVNTITTCVYRKLTLNDCIAIFVEPMYMWWFSYVSLFRFSVAKSCEDWACKWTTEQKKSIKRLWWITVNQQRIWFFCYCYCFWCVNLRCEQSFMYVS